MLLLFSFKKKNGITLRKNFEKTMNNLLNYLLNKSLNASIDNL